MRNPVSRETELGMLRERKWILFRLISWNRKKTWIQAFEWEQQQQNEPNAARDNCMMKYNQILGIARMSIKDANHTIQLWSTTPPPLSPPLLPQTLTLAKSNLKQQHISLFPSHALETTCYAHTHMSDLHRLHVSATFLTCSKMNVNCAAHLIMWVMGQ